MSAVGLESIEHTVHVTHTWINELDELLGWSNKSRSYRLLRSVLQALRDWLPVNEFEGNGMNVHRVRILGNVVELPDLCGPDWRVLGDRILPPSSCPARRSHPGITNH